MRIKLIAPEAFGEGAISSAQTFKVRKVGLPLLAALTPEGHEVRIVDEAFAPDDPEEAADLVGLSVMTDLAPRAYRLADAYRRRGVRVVMGGIHPSVLPSEALEHADSVVVGEAEDAWPALVRDAASDRLQPIYRSERPADLAGRPHPRWDLYPSAGDRGYTPLVTGVETSRGCPYDCEFCSIGPVQGRRYRVRAVPEVIAEVEALESPHLFFVDDALALDRGASKRLFAAMIPLRRKWVGQGTVSLAADRELLRLMGRSGCVGIQLGFETVQPGPAARIRKLAALTVDPAEAVRRFHDQGVAVMGAFVFGFDDEGRDAFDRTLEFAMKTRLDVPQLRVLCPFPGTRLYARMLEEGRLLDPLWWQHGHSPDTLLFRPRGMTVDEFLDGFARLNRQLYSLGAVARRFLGMSPRKRTVLGAQVFIGMNLGTRKRYLKALDTPQPLRGACASPEVAPGHRGGAVA